MPTPNMGLVLPTDHGSADTWDAILDTVFGVIDGHNHAAGSGAQVSISSLKIDSDISFVDPGGTKHAITNLKAIDFFPVLASDVTALSGAFFLNSADNELYYRTFGSVNVKVTNGAALNFAAFVGGIGGDYQAVGALESYDDSTTAYLFQQEVGAAVRQYAILRAANLQLYEYKVHGTAGVPNFSVTLKSPAALAANYALTMPAALPAAQSPLTVDAAGNIAAGALETIQIPLAWDPTTATQWNMGAIAAGSRFVPIPLRNGDRIRAVRARIQDNVTGPTKLTLSLQSRVDGTPATVATSGQSAGTGALQTLSVTGLSTLIASGTNYNIVITVATGAANCSAFWIEIDYDRP